MVQRIEDPEDQIRATTYIARAQDAIRKAVGELVLALKVAEKLAAESDRAESGRFERALEELRVIRAYNGRGVDAIVELAKVKAELADVKGELETKGPRDLNVIEARVLAARLSTGILLEVLEGRLRANPEDLPMAFSTRVRSIRTDLGFVGPAKTITPGPHVEFDGEAAEMLRDVPDEFVQRCLYSRADLPGQPVERAKAIAAAWHSYRATGGPHE